MVLAVMKLQTSGFHVFVTIGEMIPQHTISAYPHILWRHSHQSRSPLLPHGGRVTASRIMNAILFLSSPSKHATRRWYNTSLNCRCWRYLKRIASWLTVVVAVSGNERSMLRQRFAVSLGNMDCDGDETKKCIYSRTPLIRTLAIRIGLALPVNIFLP